MSIKIFRLHSSICRVAPIGSYGVYEVMNTGPLSLETYLHFRPMVLEAIKDAGAVVARLDTALDAVVEPPPINEGLYNASNSPPQAVVVRSERQLALWQRHADAMAAAGLVRVVFMAHQAEAAYRFAEVAAYFKGRNAVRRETSDSGPSPLLPHPPSP